MIMEIILQRAELKMCVVKTEDNYFMGSLKQEQASEVLQEIHFSFSTLSWFKKKK